METRTLARIDLNLLLALQVLLEERSVSRAAERLHITQPAMSKTLARLRDVFDDPLFTRGGGGIQPTPRARELADNLQHLLGDIQRLVHGSEFNPAQYSGEVTLAMSEYIGLALLPALVKRLHEQAPGLSVRTITRVENQLEQLANGKLDFALQIAQTHYPADFRVRSLGSSPPAILVRDAHPLTSGTLSWERLAEFPVIRLYVSDLEHAELMRSSDAFNRARNPQQASLETSHLLTALEGLRSTDYFLPGPAYITRNERATYGITALPLPGEEQDELDYRLVAHTRTERSAMHNWLWDQILDTLRDMRLRSVHRG